MGVLDSEKVEILLPIRTLLVERRIAVANFDPLEPAVGELPRLVHVSFVFVTGNGAAPERAVFDRTLERFGPDAAEARGLLHAVVSAEVAYVATGDGAGVATERPLRA